MSEYLWYGAAFLFALATLPDDDIRAMRLIALGLALLALGFALDGVPR